MDFYYGPVSGNSARSAFALFEAGISHTAHEVDASQGKNRDPGYLAINPMGKIPSLVDGDVTLWESNAINLYVAEQARAARLVPPSAGGRASMLRWLFFQAGHVTPACRLVFQSTSTRMREFWKMKGDPASLETGKKELARYLPVLEEALAGRDWLEGAFSLADVAYAPHLWLVAEGGFDLSATPRVKAWLDRLTARPAWVKARSLVFGS